MKTSDKITESIRLKAKEAAKVFAQSNDTHDPWILETAILIGCYIGLDAATQHLENKQ